MISIERVDAWDEEEKSSYDVALLDAEYRHRLYSERGLELLERDESDAPASKEGA